jgi:hypothetical protein
VKSRLGFVIGGFLLATLIAVAYYRSGVLNLPEAPKAFSAADAGLEGLDGLRALDERIRGDGPFSVTDAPTTEIRDALSEIRRGNEGEGVRRMESLVEREPTNLVLGNILRMEIFNLTRRQLIVNANQGEIALKLPEYLENEPAQFYRSLAVRRPEREVKLELALSLVDHMLLFPALEIKAPASVEAVEILSSVLDEPGPRGACYVPALYARGLNYLYRPFNLVWPERISAAPDAASRDIALAIAIGRKTGAGSNALKSELSLSLGDAYAKEGKLNAARSWWQLANNISHADQMRQRVFKRLRWNDDDLSENLEATLGEQMEDLDHPLSDLRFIWR